MSAIRIDHIQIAAPERCEAAAREFYSGILGMVEIEKPGPLRARGGCWFQCGQHQLHIGVDKGFRPAKKAHPAFAVEKLEALRENAHVHHVPAVAARVALLRHNYRIIDDENLPGARRFYTEDPWGNRLEFLERRD